MPVGWIKANVWPAGIIYGTVTDQAQWLIANLNRGVYKGKRLIGEATFEEIMRRQYDRFAGPMHEGWLNETTGYTAFLAGNLDNKTGFAILTNGNRSHKHLFELALLALDCLKRGIASASRP